MAHVTSATDIIYKKTGRIKESILDKNKSRQSITIGKTPKEVYSFWRDFAHLPLFMKDVSHVEFITPTRTHWVVRLESGFKVEWDVDIVYEKENEMISWASVEGSDVTTSGTIWFEKAPASLGTIVRLSMDYSVPGRKLAEFIIAFVGESQEFLIQTNLKRLKAYLETGECPTTQGQPSGREETSEKRITH